MDKPPHYKPEIFNSLTDADSITLSGNRTDAVEASYRPELPRKATLGFFESSLPKYASNPNYQFPKVRKGHSFKLSSDESIEGKVTKKAIALDYTGSYAELKPIEPMREVREYHFLHIPVSIIFGQPIPNAPITLGDVEPDLEEVLAEQHPSSPIYPRFTWLGPTYREDSF